MCPSSDPHAPLPRRPGVLPDHHHRQRLPRPAPFSQSGSTPLLRFRWDLETRQSQLVAFFPNPQTSIELTMRRGLVYPAVFSTPVGLVPSAVVQNGPAPSASNSSVSHSRSVDSAPAGPAPDPRPPAMQMRHPILFAGKTSSLGAGDLLRDIILVRGMGFPSCKGCFG